MRLPAGVETRGQRRQAATSRPPAVCLRLLRAAVCVGGCARDGEAGVLVPRLHASAALEAKHRELSVRILPNADR